jgi:hypothetical protein
MNLVAGERYMHVPSNLSGEGLFVERIKKIRYLLLAFPEYNIVYIDADTWLFHTIDEVFTDYKYDVGVCYRGVWEEQGIIHDINTGVIFFPGGGKHRRGRQVTFLDEWYEKSILNKFAGWYVDQHTINEIIGRPIHYKRSLLEYVAGKRMKPQFKGLKSGLGVMFFDALTYNCPLTMLETWRAKIVHYCHILNAQQKLVYTSALTGGEVGRDV